MECVKERRDRSCENKEGMTSGDEEGWKIGGIIWSKGVWGWGIGWSGSEEQR